MPSRRGGVLLRQALSPAGCAEACRLACPHPGAGGPRRRSGAVCSCVQLMNINSLPMVVDMTGAARIGTYTGLYYLFSTFSAIVGPNVNGWLIQLTGNNYNPMMIVAPVFMAVALGLMLGVRRGEAVTAPAGAD